MNKSILCLVLCFIQSCFAETNYVDIKTWQTKAGTPVYFVRNTSLPIVDITAVFHAGSVFDGNNFGLSSLTNNLIGNQTSKLTTDQISDQLAALGVSFDTDSDQDKATVHLRTLSDATYFNNALSIFTELLSDTKISPDTFSRVQSQVISSIQSQLQDPNYVATTNFFAELYGQTPYAHPVSGTQESVNKLTLDQTNAFYKQFYTAQNAIIVIVGDLTEDQAKNTAETITAHLTTGKLMRAPSFTAAENKTKNIFINYPGPQATVLIGKLGIARNDKNYFPLKVGSTILGDMGLTSLLMDQVRNENGLVYTIQSQFQTLQQNGPFFIAFQSKSADANRATTMTHQILQKFIENGPTAAELESSKKYINGSFPFTYATNASILRNVVNIAFYHLPLNYLNTYRENIRAITPEKIRDAFKTVFTPNQLITVTVSEKAQNHAQK